MRKPAFFPDSLRKYTIVTTLHEDITKHLKKSLSSAFLNYIFV